MLQRRPERPALEVFEEAMNNIMPVLEVKARRIGGATYQVPIEVKTGQTSGIWHFVGSQCSPVREARRHMAERLANEIMDAANNTGASVKT